MDGDAYNLRPSIVPYSWMTNIEKSAPFPDYEPSQWTQDPNRVKDWEMVGGSVVRGRIYAHELTTSFRIETCSFSTTAFTSSFSTAPVMSIRTDR